MFSYTNILFLVSILPPAYIIYQILHQDRIEKEPPKLILRCFLAGALTGPFALIFELVGYKLLCFLFDISAVEEQPGLFIVFLQNFLVIALVEEGLKYIALKHSTWNNKSFDYRFDGMVYAVVVSMGFAALENIGYVFQFGLINGLIRAVTSIPGHAVFGVFMGYFYALCKWAEYNERKKLFSYRFLSLFLPVILHGCYDFLLSTGSLLLEVVFFLYIIILDAVAIRTVKNFSLEDGPIDPAKNVNEFIY